MQNIEIEVNGKTLTFSVDTEHDQDSGAPWENSDGHGVVSDWTTRTKRPGEWVISSDHNHRRFYDFEESMRIAKRDGWGLPQEEMAAWVAERGGLEPTKSMIAERAVKKNFEYLKGWCNDEWAYVGVIVTVLDDDGDKTDVNASLWCVENHDLGYMEEVAQGLAEELAAGMGKTWGYVQKTVAVPFENGKPPE